MRRDIDTVIERVRALAPEVEVRQLQCAHPADDDGIWFFRIAGKKGEIQLESSTGGLPFLVEHDATGAGEGKFVDTVDGAVQAICEFFQKAE
jgi:hypothetical protein